jgi:hypothetical protein
MTLAPIGERLGVALAIATLFATIPAPVRAQPTSAGFDRAAARAADEPSRVARASARRSRELGAVDPPASQASGLRVVTSGCSGLRTERIEKLLSLELATLVPVVAALPPLEVDFVCTGPSVRVTLGDSVTIKDVARDVWLEASPDPERTLALAASELFLASWAELLIEQPEQRPRVSVAAVVAAKEAVERAMPSRPSGPMTAIDVLATGRERHLSEPVPTLGAALRVTHALTERGQLFADAGWETGSVDRSGGRVQVSGTAVGIGARWGVHVAQVFLSASGSVSAVYLMLDGTPSSAARYGDHVAGLAAEASAGLDATVTLSAVRLGASVSVGALAPRVVGTVVGEPSVRLDGPWVGATLFVGLLL